MRRDGKTLFTPEKVGAVRIVGAKGRVLQLEAENGQQFSFDVEAMEFVQD